MNHEVDSWIQAISSSHHDQTRPCDGISNPISPANSPCAAHSVNTHDPISPVQPSTAAAEVVFDKEIRPETTPIGKAEGTANPSGHETCTPKAFPLPSSDSTHTLDRHPREGRPSPYLTRRCPVCFSASGAKLDHSTYVMIVT